MALTVDRTALRRGRRSLAPGAGGAIDPETGQPYEPAWAAWPP